MLLALSFARSLTIGGCMQRIRAVLLGAAVFFMAAQQLPAQAQVKRQEAPKDTITRNNAFSFNKFNSETLKRIRDVAGRDTASKDTLLDTLFFVALQAKMKNNEVVRKSVDSLIKSMKDSGETEAEPEMSTWAKIGHAIYSDDEDWCKIPALTEEQPKRFQVCHLFARTVPTFSPSTSRGDPMRKTKTGQRYASPVFD